MQAAESDGSGLHADVSPRYNERACHANATIFANPFRHVLIAGFWCEVTPRWSDMAVKSGREGHVGKQGQLAAIRYPDIPAVTDTTVPLYNSPGSNNINIVLNLFNPVTKTMWLQKEES